MAPWMPRIPSTSPDERASRIAQKDACRGEVVDQKSGQGAGQHDGHYRHVIVSHAGGDHAHHHGRGKADQRGQTVHAVDQIQGIDAAQQPDDGQRNAGPAQRDGTAEDHDAIDPVAGNHDRQHGEKLQDQFSAGAEAPEVIQCAEEAGQPGRRNQGRRQLPQRRSGQVGKIECDQQPKHHGQIDGHAAPQRHATFMQLAFGVGPIDDLPSLGHPSHQRSQADRQQHRYCRGDHHGGKTTIHCPSCASMREEASEPPVLAWRCTSCLRRDKPGGSLGFCQRLFF